MRIFPGSPESEVRISGPIVTRPSGRLATGGRRYWTRVRGMRRMPARSHIDPLEMVPLLSHVFLVDVAHGPLDFRYRLVGTEIVKRSRGDYTGKRLGDLPDQRYPSRIWMHFHQVVVSAEPVTALIPFIPLPDHVVEVFAAPLSDNDRCVDKLFGTIEFPPDRGKLGTRVIF